MLLNFIKLSSLLMIIIFVLNGCEEKTIVKTKTDKVSSEKVYKTGVIEPHTNKRY